MDSDIYSDIEQDMDSIDPDGIARISRQQEHRRVKRIEYNKRAYLKNRARLREQARARYSPVVQSLDDYAPIDYDQL